MEGFILGDGNFGRFQLGYENIYFFFFGKGKVVREIWEVRNCVRKYGFGGSNKDLLFFDGEGMEVRFFFVLRLRVTFVLLMVQVLFY